ncbi:putative transposase [Salirhabdus euzebyi]|uniref:Putative transposase n=1 Tax=Salirhabdus euzebyi TaxID=394506 RepID=A0A841PS08_9BACI|nr:RNA-guided endonuclease TnpB family protein [Salirhabdus euzebyi]MBB6451580.1 putative transposase [Salirhabdus euzebyi]
MSLTYCRKIQVKFSKNDSFILDGQSKICNWFYNQLLTICKEDYETNNNSLRLLEGRNLRNYGVSLKNKYPFLNSVFSSVLKEASTRLLKAYKSYFNNNASYPKYRSWKKAWFSLVYDEPYKGWNILNNGRNISISLGNIPGLERKKGKKNPSVIGKLREKLQLDDGEIMKNLRICKEYGNQFFAIFTIERCSIKEIEFKKSMSLYRKNYNQAKLENKELPKKPKYVEEKVVIPTNLKWIALDPNHKNFFAGIDYKGDSIEFSNIKMIRYWDNIIDILKARRDLCEKKYRIRETQYLNTYTVHSPRWNRINDALNRAYNKRREQIKTALYSIAHSLYRKYDLVIIGDYTPSNKSASYSNMKRSMLNQGKIGEFRRILEWIAVKQKKYYLKIDEHNTTKKCCVCGDSEKKEPNIRTFICKNCGTEILRDINSSVNIAQKAGYILDTTIYKEKLNHFTYKGEATFGKKNSWIKNNNYLPRSG